MTITPYVADFYHENPVNFAVLKGRGIKAVFHKATDGLTLIDSEYAKRKPLALEQGLLWGAYHFMENEDPIAQAKFFLKTAGSNVRLALDWEDPIKGPPATPKMALEFLQYVKQTTSQTPWLYGSSTLRQELSSEFAEFPLWLAEYSSKASVPKPWTNYVLWQYTGNGKVAGDLSTFGGDVNDLEKIWLDTVQV